MWFDVSDVDASAVSATPSIAALTACLRHLENEASPRRLCELVWFVLTFANGAGRQLTVCYGTSRSVGARVNHRLASYPPTVRLLLYMLGPVALAGLEVAGELDDYFGPGLPAFAKMYFILYNLFPSARFAYSALRGGWLWFPSFSVLRLLRVAVRLANSGVPSTVCLIFVKYCSVMMPR